MSEIYKNIEQIIPSSLIISMEQTEQDSIYHKEGNVWLHTLMVLDEVNKFTFLTDEELQILQYSALLHDIGKIKTSKLEDGRIKSKGHSKLSYHMSMDILSELPLSFEDKFQILNLVRYHGNPYHVFERKNLEKEVISLSLQCNLKLLYYLALADFKGRYCEADDLEENLLLLEIYKEGAESLNCYTQPYQFKSDIAKFNYLVRGTHYHTDEPYDSTGSKVIMMSGLPGAGKDTYIKNHFDIPVISLDEIRKELKIKPTEPQGLVINTAKERAKEFLRKKEDFVWNATNTVKQTREGLIDLFDTYNAHISIYYIGGIDINKIIQQNRNRVSSIPEDVVRKLYRSLDIPNETEAHKIIYIC